ncbi:MAG: DinB family protein [bacterium]|nr:DinB family protein [bacterium]
MTQNKVGRLPGYFNELAGELWRMQNTRQRTLDAVDGLTDAEVDAMAPRFDNTIGATLYHIAAIEADWLYADILEVDYPDWMGDWFPFDVREEAGILSPAPGFSIANHLERLATVRGHFLVDIKQLPAEAFALFNGVAENPSTPEWVLHHLRQHEGEHRGQIQSIRTVLDSA